ncbi:hypothetical protein B296_00034384, partial [Ensete ventricosum]
DVSHDRIPPQPSLSMPLPTAGCATRRLLPPGFRFHPTDEELVMHYLCRKCAGLPVAVRIVAELDLYKFDPWQLPGRFRFGLRSRARV